eukprot:TRINITY_DN31679_c0_g1_i3.p1 TRINITY_DN31679_c0_g1~~TRINITY_DN31679_c0_g1_i3.p1  ORF type:complete len:693 (+),score=159.28 TRINITY_DN31679_c0_g1_i3:100-2178(+)
MCSAHNFANRSACYKCGVSNPNQSSEVPAEVRPGDWTCPICRAHNFASKRICYKCMAPNPNPPPAPDPASLKPPTDVREGDWMCPVCAAHNFASKKNCFKCKLPHPNGGGSETISSSRPGPYGVPVGGVNGNWTCLGCRNVNFPARTVCNRCKAPKPPEADAANLALAGMMPMMDAAALQLAQQQWAIAQQQQVTALYMQQMRALQQQQQMVVLQQQMAAVQHQQHPAFAHEQPQTTSLLLLLLRPLACHELLTAAPCAMARRRQSWQVVGGSDKGGIVVRAGRELTSAQLPEKLATGALVEELERAGDRLNYKLVDGTGPKEGWVSVRLKDKVLLELQKEEESGSAPQRAPGAAKKAKPVTAESTAAAPAGGSDQPDFSSRLQELREEFPGCVDLEVPVEAARWSASDLRNFFESGGFIRPKGNTAGVQPDTSSTGTKLEAAAAPAKDNFATGTAMKLLDNLHANFGSKDFQQKLQSLQRRYPERRTRGHRDGAAYFESFEALVLTVYQRVLPAHGLRGDWDGVQEMFSKLTSALHHPKVKKQHEEINLLLGLPREARLVSSRREDALVYCPGADAAAPEAEPALFEDEDGDKAQEFLVEDEASGELQSVARSIDSWFKVLQKPCAPIRNFPDEQSGQLGKFDKGKRLRVQRIAGRWLLLHQTELQKLGGVAEAWVLWQTGTERFLESVAM